MAPWKVEFDLAARKSLESLLIWLVTFHFFWQGDCESSDKCFDLIICKNHPLEKKKQDPIMQQFFFIGEKQSVGFK